MAEFSIYILSGTRHVCRFVLISSIKLRELRALNGDEIGWCIWTYVVTGPHICVCTLSIKMKNYRIKCQFIRHLLKTCIFWIKLLVRKANSNEKRTLSWWESWTTGEREVNVFTWMGGGVPMPLNCDLGSYVDNDFPLTKMGKLWEMVILERKTNSPDLGILSHRWLYNIW